MLHSIWNHQGPYRVTADASSAPRASAGNVSAVGLRPALAAPTSPRRMPGRTRAVAAAVGAVRVPEPVHPLIQAMQQARPDLGALIEHKFQPMRRALLGTVFLRQALRDLIPALPRAPHGLPGLPQVLLVQALAVATGSDAPRAAAALAALRQLDPQRDIARAWRLRGEPCATPAPDSVAAWRVAMELATTPCGMDVLQAVLDAPVAPACRNAFAALLKAAQQLAGDSAQATTPVSLLRGPMISPGQAGQALACAAARLAGEPQAVPAGHGPTNARHTQAHGGPVRPRSVSTLSVPFSRSAMACWSFISASRAAAGIATAVSDAMVRCIAQPAAVAPAILPGPWPAGPATR